MAGGWFLDQVPGGLYGKEAYAADSHNNEIALGNQRHDRPRFVLVALLCRPNWRWTFNDRAGILQRYSIFGRCHGHGGGNGAGAVSIPDSGEHGIPESRSEPVKTDFGGRSEADALYRCRVWGRLSHGV